MTRRKQNTKSNKAQLDKVSMVRDTTKVWSVTQLDKESIIQSRDTLV